MSHKIHVWQEEKQTADGFTTLSATIEYPKGKRQTLWYRLLGKYDSYLTSSCDPFVVGLLFQFMARRTDVVIHGQVSPSLLKNLCEYQAIWHCWKPTKYHQVEIEAEIEQEESFSGARKGAIATFSGGVDSCFTMYRHKKGLCGRQTENIEAGVMVHGFDIPLSEEEIFKSASEKAGKMLKSLDVELITMASNFRELGQKWEDTFGTAVASFLRLFSKRFSCGLIPSSEPYQALSPHLGAHPLIDPSLGSNNFPLIHDGAAFTRIEKIKQLTQWQEALKYLTVCWYLLREARNCGKCEKCIRTILDFRALGKNLPSCFEEDVDDFDILKLAFIPLNEPKKIEMKLILEQAKQSHISELWVRELQLVLLTNKITQPLISQSLKTKIKQLLNK